VRTGGSQLCIDGAPSAKYSAYSDKVINIFFLVFINSINNNGSVVYSINKWG